MYMVDELKRFNRAAVIGILPRLGASPHALSKAIGVNERPEDMCTPLRVRFVDPYNVFYGRADLYLLDEVHLNKRGKEVFRDMMIIDVILNEKILIIESLKTMNKTNMKLFCQKQIGGVKGRQTQAITSLSSSCHARTAGQQARANPRAPTPQGRLQQLPGLTLPLETVENIRSQQQPGTIPSPPVSVLHTWLQPSGSLSPLPPVYVCYLDHQKRGTTTLSVRDPPASPGQQTADVCV
ncbi:hypothetical protein Pcinc_026344 [Petrolisthes cinctipes]|uniref:Uncharacterized protein n=1 Tax=Petrolisthes cinctipes TaxID=88211 RepID=A0AAE1F8L3_PETCI|nr:hypothetical protein Pcinc_026344 [Petrolisthes cinctipes]